MRAQHAQIQRLQGLLVDRHGASVLEVGSRVFDERREEIAELRVAHAVERVEIGVLRKAAVEEEPGEPLDGVLHRRDGAAGHGGVEHVGEVEMKRTLHGQRLEEELVEVVLLGDVRHHHRFAARVLAATRRKPDHFEEIHDGIVHVAVIFAVVEARV